MRGEDVTERSIYVRGKGDKAASVPTHPILWDLAQDYPRRGYWFPPRRAGSTKLHVDSTTVTSTVTHHFAALGIEGSCHRGRHTYATRLLRSGANLRVVQTLMRHESLTTTARYCAVDEDERMAAVLGLIA